MTNGLAGQMTDAGIGVDDAVEALLQAMSVWDAASIGHSRRTAVYAEAIARELRMPEVDVEAARIGALLHDIGKMGVDLEILNKPGKLDDREADRVRLHPAMGEAILARLMPAPVVACAAAHHEQPDGNGYPAGLGEEQIPVGALICRVADVFDSLTTHQSYRPAMSRDEAMAELHSGSGSRYSARIVETLCGLLERDGLGIAA